MTLPGKESHTAGNGPLFAMATFLREVACTSEDATLPRVSVVDAGAMDVGEPPLYAPLVECGLADVVGFEPLEEECAKLNDHGAQRNVEQGSTGATHRYLPVALGDGRPGEFRRCSQGMTSSLLEPNINFLSQFNLLAEVTTVVARSKMATVRLDELLPQLPGQRVDLLKLDVQGYELAVLNGAEEALRHTLVVHTEVEFVEMYENQPLFADVDSHLRARGFKFHRFFGIKGVPAKPLTLPMPDPPYSQQLWADAVYVRGLWSSSGELAALGFESSLRLALILHEVYMSYDAAHHVLAAIDMRMAVQYRDAILSRMRLPSASHSQVWASNDFASGQDASGQFVQGLAECGRPSPAVTLSEAITWDLVD